MCGGDLCPRDSIQTIMAAFGVFIAAYINANIFGELTMILQSIGIEEQKFQSKLSFCNNTMINLKLPQHIQWQVRHQLKSFHPLEIN